jgi:hypothetical protein
MAAVSILLIIVISVIVGGVTGVVLGSEGDIWVAVLAGLFAVIISNVVRNIAMVRGLRLGPDDRRIPNLVIVFAAISSLAGSMTTLELTQSVAHFASGLLGMLSGLISALLMAMLMITYHMNPDPRKNLIRE